MPTAATILSRIRTRLNEATARFWADSDLLDWYSDAAADQLRQVLGTARQLDRLGDTDHPYLRKYATFKLFPVAAGTQDLALPTDFVEAVGLSISDASSVREQEARRISAADKWYAENLPHFGPAYDRPLWSIQTVDGNLVRLHLYVWGNRGAPNQPLIARLEYYREVTRAPSSGTSASVDTDDPYNEGPVWKAVGQALARRGADPTVAIAMASNATMAILAPPAASQATSGEAKAMLEAKTAARADSRD